MRGFYDYFYKLYIKDIETINKDKISYQEWLSAKYPNYETIMKLNDCIISIGASLIIAGIPISIVAKDMELMLISLGGLVISLYSLKDKNDKENAFLEEYFNPKEEFIEEYENDVHNKIELTINSEKKQDFEFTICAFEEKLEKIIEQFEIFVFITDEYEKNMLYVFLKNLVDENVLKNYDNYYDLFMSVANRVCARGIYDNKNVFIDDFIDEIYKLEEDNLLLKRRTDIFNNIINKRKDTDNSCNIINIERKK